MASDTDPARRARGPSDWLLRHRELLSPGGRALDVASGDGRHALVVASWGWAVRAVDRDAAALARLRAAAARQGLSIDTAVVDLERADVSLGEAAYDAVLVFRYLHRPLFPALVRALAPGGVLLYETFTRAHAAVRPKPSNPAFLLAEGELLALVAGLEILDARESEVSGAHLASIAARKPACAGG
jgi:SAM-dependent methyltransferase